MEHIIENWANKIVEWSSSGNESFTEEQKEVLAYGYILFLENAYKLLLLIVVALLTHTLCETIVTIGSLILLRNFAGGIHCKGSTGCTLSMLGVWGVGLLVSKIQIPIYIHILIAIIIAWTIMKYAPKTTSKNPIVDPTILKNKHMGAVLVMCLLMIIAFVSYYIGCRDDIANMILVSMLIEAFSILLLVEKEERTNEKG